MDDWRHRILNGLRSSKILLVCLSPNYFRSEYCRWEWEEYLRRQVHQLMGHESITPVYFVEVPGSDEQQNAVEFDRWVKSIEPWKNDVLRSNFIDIRPNGSVMLDFGGQFQKIANPNVPIRQQKFGNFIFDQQIN